LLAKHILNLRIDLGPVIDGQAVTLFVGNETLFVLFAKAAARSSPSSSIFFHAFNRFKVAHTH
jgi:hypothetical protein